MSFYGSGVISKFFSSKQNSLIAVTMFVKQTAANNFKSKINNSYAFSKQKLN